MWTLARRRWRSLAITAGWLAVGAVVAAATCHLIPQPPALAAAYLLAVATVATVAAIAHRITAAARELAAAAPVGMAFLRGAQSERERAATDITEPVLLPAAGSEAQVYNLPTGDREQFRPRGVHRADAPRLGRPRQPR